MRTSEALRSRYEIQISIMPLASKAAPTASTNNVTYLRNSRLRRVGTLTTFVVTTRSLAPSLTAPPHKNREQRRTDSCAYHFGPPASVGRAPTGEKRC